MSTIDSTVLRILDANFNRAREALRVMEEYARFVLDDPSLVFAIKDARHELVEHIPKAVAKRLVERREILGDVGTELGTDSEYSREAAVDVAVASAKRLGEALRVIEEYGKTIDRGFAESIERLRYHGYELERKLVTITRARQRFGHVRLYVLITESLCANDWFATAEAVLDGGADCLQLREKTLTDRELLDRANRLARLCREREKLFIVNDRSDVAAASHAHGVHLGKDDLPVAAARRLLPSEAVVGKSTHTIEQFHAAIEECPDYIAVGPMFASTTKPQQHVPGPELLARARLLTSIPIVAIGGINHENAAEVVEAGQCGVCVCAAIVGRKDVAAEAGRMRRIAN